MMQCKDLLEYTYHVTTESRVQTHSDLGVFLSSPQRSVPLGFPTEIKKSLMQTLHQKKLTRKPVCVHSQSAEGSCRFHSLYSLIARPA